MRHFLPKPRQLLKLFCFLIVTSFLSIKLLLHRTSTPLPPVRFLGLTKPFGSDDPLLVLRWTWFFGDKTWDNFYAPLDPTCPHKCEFTNDNGLLIESQAVLFNIRNLEAPWGYDLPAAPRKIRQIWIAHSAEPPQYTYPHPVYFPSVFNWTSFMRPDSDAPLYYKKVIRNDELRVNQRVIWKNTEIPQLPVIKKHLALVSWLVSNCYTYSHRETYVKKLKHFMGVDIYGQCWGRDCDHEADPPSCLDEIKQHMFYLSFENAQCAGYVTEKFWNALMGGMIPVVVADRSSVARVAPPGSYIHVEDYESPEALAQYLTKVSQNETLYQSYFLWRKNYVLVSDYLCELCTKLREWNGHTQTYADFGAWFLQDECSYFVYLRFVRDLWSRFKYNF